MFSIKIADVPIAIDNRYPVVEKLSQDYLTSEPPLFCVSACDGELKKEAALLDEKFSLGELESIALYRKIADRIYEKDALVVHGAVVELDGAAYLFTAKSGVGKTTHARLWLSAFGERASILNGDKPLLRVIDGSVIAAGTPWRGKEGYGAPRNAPLRGIAFLERAPQNSASPETPSGALTRFVTQTYLPRGSAASGARALALIDSILRTVPLISLRCNMEPDAPLVALNAFGEAEKEKLLQSNLRIGDKYEQRS